MASEKNNEMNIRNKLTGMKITKEGNWNSKNDNNIKLENINKTKRRKERIIAKLKKREF